jgi:hypothetical protein
MTPKLPEALARAAESKIGIHESGGPNKGAALAEFFAADDYKPNAADNGYPWCAAFVCWCIKFALAATGTRETPTFWRPKTPAAFGFEGWCRSVDRSAMLKKAVTGDIKRGDIVIFTFSHVGIAVGDVDEHGNFETVEGNTNQAGSREGEGVYRKTRHQSAVRSRIRFMI